MLKKWITFSLVFIIGLATAVIAPTNSHAVSGHEPTYTYWMQEKSSYQSTSYGKWTSQKGTLTGPINMKKSYNVSTTYSITANAGLGNKVVSAGLDGMFTKQTDLKTEASRAIPKGQTGVFQIRYEYKTYKVKMEEWLSLDGRKELTGRTKYVTVKKRTDVGGRIILK
ncbi:hypothetical protein [Priestia koreensis]|uniref:hypothetical protein n=1 Tax=Priestia koreensis TaxID=284581 RepID=UPI001F595A2E|nr:hypothetical protein [Priestia koreensis]UNL83162.1 hypothetical protein IE339_13265 [Priestia koreensis]